MSAVKPEHLVIEAPAKVFDDQLDLLRAFEAGELDGQDFVAVIRYQGPSANGMPELHKLTPPLAVLLDRGQRVAIVTDGRMSGASGKVPAAIHLSPEAADGGPIALVREGDLIRLDSAAGTLDLLVPAEELAAPHARRRAAERRAVGGHRPRAVRRLPPCGGPRRARRGDLRPERPRRERRRP